MPNNSLKITKDFKRPWGGFIKFIDNKPCTVKILLIEKQESLSLQSHKLRQEFWYVLSGKIKITTGKTIKSLKIKTLKKGQSIVIPRQYPHRATGLASPYSEILEISTGKFEEKDEIRYDDKYGRN